ncbi:hypothetical protein LguiA_013718 [Lonicera macranthoides]
MESGSGPENRDKGESQKGRKKDGSLLPKIEPFVPKRDHNPRELMSWAKRTGFVSNFSGEVGPSVREGDHTEKNDSDGFDLERGNGSGSPKIEIDPVLGRTKNRVNEIEPDLRSDGGVRGEKERKKIEVEPILGEKEEERGIGLNRNGGRYSNGHGGTTSDANGTKTTPMEQKKDDGNVEREIGIDVFPYEAENSHGGWNDNQSMKCGLRDNPGFVVVAPTVAAVGLAFFSYGFPQAGTCVEISLPQILLLLIFTLVPLSVAITWAYAFFLTAGGAYNYKGCTTGIPSSNILNDACRRHAYTMQHCRADVSNAWRSASWVRIPYPLQWGIPIFQLRTSIIMVVTSIVASVDSVGTYHSVSIKVNSIPPTRGIVSRGIGLEGFCSFLAGLWGSGTGSTTLTENVHTIDITKVASRRAVEIGAGKVGAVLASIPQALAAAVMCFMWALIVTLGLATFQHSQTGSFRNVTIVGVSLFLGLSIPAYFQQYQPNSSLILPGYFIPFSAASNGPVQTGSKQLDFAINALLSLNMVVTLLVAFVLDNTVPGTRQERGVYIWSNAKDPTMDPSSLSNYSLPRKFARFFHWAKCLGT